MTLVQPDFGIRRERPEVRVEWAGQTVDSQQIVVRQDPPGFFNLQLALGEADTGAIGRLVLEAPAFIPHDQEPANADTRPLGVQIEAIDVQVDNRALRFADLPVLPPLPAS
jgi:hypothetical protein